MNRHTITAFVLVFAMVFSMAACGAKSETPSQASAPAETTSPSASPETTAAPAAEVHYAADADTIVLCMGDETPSVTAREHNARAGSFINNLTYEQLMALDDNLTPQPHLAESYEYEEQADGSVLWTFYLRKGVKFHDGTEMKAVDVVASLNEAKESPDVAAAAREYDNVTAVDDYTVTMTTAKPSAGLLFDLSGHGNAIVPAALIESGNDFNSNPVGTGPYVFKEWKISEYLTFERFEDYWGEKAKVKNIVWKVIPEGSARTIALQAHEVDMIVDLDSNDQNLIMEDPTLSIVKQDGLAHSWLTINNQKKPFDNQLVRKAMNAAINKEDCVTVALNGCGIVAPAQTPKGLMGFDATGMDPYDVELAKKYEEESGVDLSTVSFVVICSDDTKRRAAQVIQSNLNDTFGMNVELTSMDLATYLSETAAGNFEGFIGGYNSSDMTSFLKGLYHSESIGGSNKTRTNDPALDEMITKACATVDNTDREEQLKAISRYLNDLCAQIPLYQNGVLAAHASALQNVTINPAYRFYPEKWSWE